MCGNMNEQGRGIWAVAGIRCPFYTTPISLTYGKMDDRDRLTIIMIMILVIIYTYTHIEGLPF